MKHFSTSIKNVFCNLQDLLTGIQGKPALWGAMVFIVTLVTFDAPVYGIPLLILCPFLIHVASRHLQKASLAALILALISHYALHSPINPIKSQDVPQQGCGIVETIQKKSSGLAVIINSGSNKIRLTEKRDLPIMPMAGDSICYEASWYPVNPPTVPGAFDTRQWLQSQGLTAYGKFKHWDVYSHRLVPERYFYKFRQWIARRFADYLDPAETGLLLGLLAGDKSGIPDALRSDFQRTGLVHVLAISGFHVVLLAGMLMILLKATGLPHHIVRLLAVLLLLLYIPVTGGSPAVRRAVIMFSVPLIGATFQKQPNPLNSLGIALFIIMFPEPEVIWNPGFQLSVAATAGIIISGPLNPLQGLPKKLTKNKLWAFFQGAILEPTYVTFCATLSTAPFLIHHFKTLSPVAWFGNIVVVPAISMGMQAGLFALLSPLDILRQNFCYAAKFFLRLATLLTRLLSDSSEASATVGPFGPALLLLLGLVILLAPAAKKNRLVQRFYLTSLLVFCGTFAYGNFIKASVPNWQLTTLDIGQGDSHLLTTPSQKHFLIDAGDGTQNTIVPYLHHIGVSHLDAFIITHPDLDHYGGALSLIKTFPVKELWITDCARIEDKSNWQKFIQEAYSRGIIIRDMERGLLWKEHLFQIEILHPVTRRCVDVNTQSITLRAKGLGHSALLTGDLTIAGEKEIMNTDMYIKSDVLKLGHHGSKTSSSRVFLQKVQPQLAIVSSGRHNRFRHPSKQVIQRLDSLGIPYVNTAEKGTIHILFSSEGVQTSTMLE